MSADVPFFPNHRPERLERYIDHFLVVCFGKHTLVIGEAWEVKQVASDKWEASVGLWAIDLATHQRTPGIFGHVDERCTVERPYRLIPKADYVP